MGGKEFELSRPFKDEGLSITWYGLSLECFVSYPLSPFLIRAKEDCSRMCACSHSPPGGVTRHCRRGSRDNRLLLSLNQPTGKSIAASRSHESGARGLDIS